MSHNKRRNVKRSLFRSRKWQKKHFVNVKNCFFENYSLEQTCLHLPYFYVEYETSISSWHIWNDYRTKVKVLPLFQIATRLKSQYPNETEIHNEHLHINLNKNTGTYNCHIWNIEPRPWGFCHYFSSIHDFWSTNSRNSSVLNSWIEMERWKNVFSCSSKCEKRISAKAYTSGM